jgi:hypothetical protein
MMLEHISIATDRISSVAVRYPRVLAVGLTLLSRRLVALDAVEPTGLVELRECFAERSADRMGFGLAFDYSCFLVLNYICIEISPFKLNSSGMSHSNVHVIGAIEELNSFVEID